MSETLSFGVAVTDSASQALNKIKQNVEGLTNSVKSSSSKIADRSDKNREWLIAIGIASGAAFAWLVSLWKTAVTTAASFEQLQISFETMLGGTNDAKLATTELISQLEKFSAISPFEFPQVAEQAKSLMAFWIQLKDIMPTMNVLWDISALLGTDKLPRLSYALWQVHANGKLLGWEFKQLVETGIPIWEMLSKHTGIANINGSTVAKLNISYKTLMDTLTEATSKWGLYYQGMLKQASTFNGLMSTLSETIWYVFRDIWQTLLPTLKSLAVYFTDVALKLRSWTQEHPELARNILIVVTTIVWLIAAIWAIWLAIWPIIAWIWLLWWRWVWLWIWAVALAEIIIMNRKNIGAFLSYTVEWISNMMKWLWNWILTVWNTGISIVVWLLWWLVNKVKTAASLLNNIPGVDIDLSSFDRAKSTLSAFWDNAKATYFTLSENNLKFSDSSKKAGKSAEEMATDAKNAFNKLWWASKEAATAVWDGKEKTKNYLQDMKDWFKDFSQKTADSLTKLKDNFDNDMQEIADKAKDVRKQISDLNKQYGEDNASAAKDMAANIVEQEQKIADIKKDIADKTKEVSTETGDSKVKGLAEIAELQKKLEAETVWYNATAQLRKDLEAQVTEARRLAWLTEIQRQMEEYISKKALREQEYMEKKLQLQSELSNIKTQQKIIQSEYEKTKIAILAQYKEAFDTYQASIEKQKKITKESVDTMKSYYEDLSRTIQQTIDKSSKISGAATSSVKKYAEWGVITGWIRAFASGGVVSSPTLGLIWEGQYNEAVVPLPNGRSIPVQMSWGGNGWVTINIGNLYGTDKETAVKFANDIVSQFKGQFMFESF